MQSSASSQQCLLLCSCCCLGATAENVGLNPDSRHLPVLQGQLVSCMMQQRTGYGLNVAVTTFFCFFFFSFIVVLAGHSWGPYDCFIEMFH